MSKNSKDITTPSSSHVANKTPTPQASITGAPFPAININTGQPYPNHQLNQPLAEGYWAYPGYEPSDPQFLAQTQHLNHPQSLPQSHPQSHPQSLPHSHPHTHPQNHSQFPNQVPYASMGYYQSLQSIPGQAGLAVSSSQPISGQHVAAQPVQNSPGQIQPRLVSAHPRKRSLTACDTCRQKKSKCDNVRPRCGACVRAGNMNCRYRSDYPGSDYSLYDPALLTIILKLDTVLRHLKNKGDGSDRGSASLLTHFQHCVWDMLLMSMFRWRSVQRVLGISDSDHANWTRRLLLKHDKSPELGLPRSFPKRFDTCNALEDLLRQYISSFTNSFFLHAHTKVPCLDIVTLLESIEIYTLMQRANPKTTFISMLEDYAGNPVPQSYKDTLLTLGIEDLAVRRRAFKDCCESVPLILVVCAVGIIACPVKLDNHQRFDTSLEESKSVESCGIDFSKLPSSIPRNRRLLSRCFIEYALIVSSVYPSSLKRNTLVSVMFHILLNQYYLYNMDPLSAHRAIVTASTDMMYYLEKENTRLSSSEKLKYFFAEKRSVVDRLFWTCLKLECELRAELSPHVPLSGITQIVPPSPFLKIPDPVLIDEHLPDSGNLANKYDDKNSWYFFLTEVAVRKVDNKLFDELYSVDAVSDNLWDLEAFIEKEIWKLQIKYLKQYDAIVTSLSPRIRSFVLLEVDTNEIHASMKRRAIKKRNAQEAFDPDILDNLDEFFIDEDLLLRAQSESIMFIKTRFLASKIALFRPINYLILEDKVLLGELLEAAAAVLKHLKTESAHKEMAMHNSPLYSASTASANNDSLQPDSSSSSSQFANNFMDGEEAYIEAIKAPDPNRSNSSEDTFNDIVEHDHLKDENHPDFLIVKDYVAARRRVLQSFVKNLVTIPKGNIPKIGLHRHSGAWYYVRQLVLGNLSLFMLYKKVQQAIQMLVQNNAFAAGDEVMEALNLVFNRELIKGLLEYTMLMLNYWKEESNDCDIYIEQIQLCLDAL